MEMHFTISLTDEGSHFQVASANKIIQYLFHSVSNQRSIVVLDLELLMKLENFMKLHDIRFTVCQKWQLQKDWRSSGSDIVKP